MRLIQDCEQGGEQQGGGRHGGARKGAGRPPSVFGFLAHGKIVSMFDERIPRVIERLTELSESAIPEISLRACALLLSRAVPEGGVERARLALAQQLDNAENIPMDTRTTFEAACLERDLKDYCKGFDFEKEGERAKQILKERKERKEKTEQPEEGKG